MKNPDKITIIIPYFGQFPGWMDYFLLSCKFNPDITWLFFTDCPIPDIRAGNLRFIPFTMNDFNQLASRKLGLSVKIKHPYKLCDFKPAYGDIFEDYIPDSSYWGYGDLDLIYGNIRDFFQDDELQRYDIISNHPDFVTGHLCILRNTPQIRELYRSGNAYKKVFTETRYKGFDEQLRTLSISPDPKYLGTMQSLNLFLHILFTSLLKILKRLRPWKSNRKVNLVAKNELRDFTSIVKNAETQRKVRVHFKKTFQSDLMLRKMGEKKWSIKWDRGYLCNEADNSKLLYFHFILSKFRKSFRIGPFIEEVQSFTVSKSGIKIWTGR